MTAVSLRSATSVARFAPAIGTSWRHRQPNANDALMLNSLQCDKSTYRVAAPGSNKSAACVFSGTRNSGARFSSPSSAQNLSFSSDVQLSKQSHRQMVFTRQVAVGAEQGQKEQEGTGAPALAYVVVYVDDVEKSISFYEKAFGLKTRMATGKERTAWGEMETGSTTLAFTPKAQRETSLSGGVKAHGQEEQAPPVVISLTYVDVHAAYKHAVASGAKACADPEEKPWGMTAGYVKDIDGILVQIGSRVKSQT